MSKLAQLAALDVRSYANEVKARLRDDEAWIILLDPVLIERTRLGLRRIVTSIDAQKARAIETGDASPSWLHSINGLRRHTKARLDAMAPPEVPILSNSKESKAWRALSASLAVALGAGDPEALDTLKTPYGNMTAREWLAAREDKKGIAR